MCGGIATSLFILDYMYRRINDFIIHSKYMYARN